MALSYAGGTDIGNLSAHNEDAYFADPELGLWLVADGMGGHEAGEVASQVVKEAVTAAISQQQSLSQSIQLAHEAIKSAGQTGRGAPGMGSTIVALHSVDETYTIGWVGDSRAYSWEGGKLTQITTDHSFVQRLVESGAISQEEAQHHPNRNIIVHSLGAVDVKDAHVDTLRNYWLQGQKILLCSDGLSDEVRDSQISQIFEKYADNDQQIVDKLIQAALENGGGDNITAIIISAPDDAPSHDQLIHMRTQKIVPDRESLWRRLLDRWLGAIALLLTILLTLVLILYLAGQ